MQEGIAEMSSGGENPLGTACRWLIYLLLLLQNIGCFEEAAPDIGSAAWLRYDGIARFHVHSPDQEEVSDALRQAMGQHAARLNRKIVARCEDVTIGVLGDSRASIEGVGVSTFFRPMLSEIKSIGAELILHVGDLVKRGTRATEWATYARHLPVSLPVVPVRGNHDRGSHFYDDNFGISPVFTLNYGVVRIIGFDSEGTPEALDARLRELELHLKPDTEQWKIVLLHRPIWSRGPHGSNELGLNDRLTALFERAEVDLVISGHDHNYERFCPTKGVHLDRPCLPLGNAPIYLVSGGGATVMNPIPSFWRTLSHSDYDTLKRTSVAFSGRQHFLKITASPTEFELVAIASAHSNIFGPSILDRFQLERANRSCRSSL